MSNLYTIFGNKGILYDNKLNEILDSLKPSEYDMVNIDLDEDSIITLLNEIEAAPFLYDLRVVVLEHPSFLYKVTDERLVQSFINFLNNPVETTVLITIINDDDLNKINKKDDSRPKIMKDALNALKSKTNNITLNKLNSGDMDSIIESMLEGYKISNRAKEELKNRVDKDYNRMIVELEKLKIYKEDIKEITEEDVITLVPRDLDDNVYNLISAIVSHNRRDALQILQDFKLSGVGDNYVLSTLISKFCELYQVKVLSEAKYSKEEIAAFFNASPGRAYYMMRDVSKYKLDTLRDEMKSLVNMDYDIKRGKKDINQALELYILNI